MKRLRNSGLIFLVALNLAEGWVSDFRPKLGTHLRRNYYVSLFAAKKKRSNGTPQNKKKTTKPKKKKRLPPLFMSTALGIIPPDSAWDTIQRARHFSRDASYTRWPPCIRMFHPFSKDLALAVARVIEKFNVEPFELTLESWSVIPNLEAMESDWRAKQKLPPQEPLSDDRKSRDQEESERLIRTEERLGRERLRIRKLKHARKGMMGKSTNAAQSPSPNSSDHPMNKQRSMYEEYNGPCLVCVEPDQESKDRLQELRGLLCSELGLDPDFSASSASSGADSLPLAAKETEFRALLPVGSFPSVDAAIDVARYLRENWEPLTFSVTNFQVISDEPSSTLPTDSGLERKSEHHEEISENLLPNALYSGHAQEQEMTLAHDGEFGCDALIMFMGEESDIPETLEKPSDFEIVDDSGSGIEGTDLLSKGSGSGLELWLDQDNDTDEGTVVVKGRTLFFTGETREFVGMPATSVMDGKDRFTNGIGGSVRRRGTVHRTGSQWKDGEWGRRQSDQLPRPSRSRPGRKPNNN